MYICTPGGRRGSARGHASRPATAARVDRKQMLASTSTLHPLLHPGAASDAGAGVIVPVLSHMRLYAIRLCRAIPVGAARAHASPRRFRVARVDPPSSG